MMHYVEGVKLAYAMLFSKEVLKSASLVLFSFPGICFHYMYV